MTASADKVQHILQNCLQESINLVKRGVFSQQELQSIMLQRQKCEHAMLKTTYQMTDYLSSIEYQYELERQRKKRMTDISKMQQGSKPLFRKQSSADYAVVKRIIRLWDRTMHKFKFELKLWKQYLAFTLAISSKKNFYKALTNAIRFLPFEVDLWKIGATYEMERGMNMWKGRKLLVKGLRMVPEGLRNLSLAEFMIGYEVQFLRKLIQRKNILIKGDSPMKLYGVEQHQVDSQSQEERQIETMNLSQYNKLIWLIVEQAIRKNCNISSQELSFKNVKQRLLKLIVQIKKKEEDSEVKLVLQKVRSQLNQFEGRQMPDLIIKEEQTPIKIENEDVEKNKLAFEGDVDAWKERFIDENTKINWKIVQQALKTFCLKPKCTAEVFNYLLAVNPSQTIQFIVSKKGSQKLPVATTTALLDLYLRGERGDLSKLLKLQIDRWLAPQDLKNEENLFEKIVKFNSLQDRFDSTTKLLRSLSIFYRNDPEYLALCNQIGNLHE